MVYEIILSFFVYVFPGFFLGYFLIWTKEILMKKYSPKYFYSCPKHLVKEKYSIVHQNKNDKIFKYLSIFSIISEFCFRKIVLPYYYSNFIDVYHYTCLLSYNDKYKRTIAIRYLDIEYKDFYDLIRFLKKEHSNKTLIFSVSAYYPNKIRIQFNNYI